MSAFGTTRKCCPTHLKALKVAKRTLAGHPPARVYEFTP
jgi:hypothetical protein